MESTRSLRRVVLVGNPNVGKSLIFSCLTRAYATVSNYPGTTVEVTRAAGRAIPREPEVIDTPGTNSLVPLSDDERVTRDLLLEPFDTTVILVGDAKNPRRTLLLALELAELDLPFLVVLNMADEADERGIPCDVPLLSAWLGVPVIRTVATRREGIDALIAALPEARTSARRAALPPDLEEARAEVVRLLPTTMRGRDAVAGMVLSGDFELLGRLVPLIGLDAAARIQSGARRLSVDFPASLAGRITRARLKPVDRFLTAATPHHHLARSLRRTLGDLAVHRFWGIPIVLMVLWVSYEVVGVFGAGIAVDWLETHVFGGYVNPWVTGLAGHLPWPILRDLLVGEYGIVTMALTYAIAIVLPIVFFFFVIFGMLEDSGYLPRLAVMLNRPMRVIGLNGKAVLPMVLGLGCDTMATLTARVLETKRERLLVTFLLALAVPCSAQLAVVLALTRRLSPMITLVWAGVVLASLVGVGWLAARLVPGDRSDFILELPPLRRPRLANILNKTLARLEWYLKEAVPLFVAGTLLLFVLDRIGALVVLQKAAAPVVVNLLSLPPQMASAFVVGFLRRDYGSVYLAEAAGRGELSGVQVLVSLVVLTLFIPCVANYLIMVKERGFRTAVAMAAFIVPFAFLMGAALNWALHLAGITL
ncbi:MAG TPA: ferrous iron transport protein B [Candidatus Eisenbacteria bacterium]